MARNANAAAVRNQSENRSIKVDAIRETTVMYEIANPLGTFASSPASGED